MSLGVVGAMTMRGGFAMPGRILSMSAFAAILVGCATETRTIVAPPPSLAVAGPVQAKPMAESRAACQAYGIAPYTERFERCVRNEYVYRVPG